MIVTDKGLLSIPCTPVNDLEEGIEICHKLREEVKNHPDAIGLAANQIGINKRVIIIKSKSYYSDEDTWHDMINPVILDKKRLVVVKSEGCLSFPNELVMTERYHDVWVTSLTYIYSYHYKGIEAICIQHELDHLDGITFHERQYKQK